MRRLSEKDIEAIVEAEAMKKLVDEIDKAWHAKPRRKLANSLSLFMDYDARIAAWAREAIRRGEPPAETLQHLTDAKARGEKLLEALRGRRRTEREPPRPGI
jgi:hypothetical protein